MTLQEVPHIRICGLLEKSITQERIIKREQRMQGRGMTERRGVEMANSVLMRGDVIDWLMEFM